MHPHCMGYIKEVYSVYIYKHIWQEGIGKITHAITEWQQKCHDAYALRVKSLAYIR